MNRRKRRKVAKLGEVVVISLGRCLMNGKTVPHCTVAKMHNTVWAKPPHQLNTTATMAAIATTTTMMAMSASTSRSVILPTPTGQASRPFDFLVIE